MRAPIAGTVGTLEVTWAGIVQLPTACEFMAFLGASLLRVVRRVTEDAR